MIVPVKRVNLVLLPEEKTAVFSSPSKKVNSLWLKVLTSKIMRFLIMMNW